MLFPPAIVGQCPRHRQKRGMTLAELARALPGRWRESWLVSCRTPLRLRVYLKAYMG